MQSAVHLNNEQRCSWGKENLAIARPMTPAVSIRRYEQTDPLQ